MFDDVPDDDEDAVIDKILNENIDFSELDLTIEEADLIEGMLCKDPEERLDINQIRNNCLLSNCNAIDNNLDLLVNDK